MAACECAWELLRERHEQATAERMDVPVPLLDRLEGFTADGGGEVHKSGGVIETVAPEAKFNHCGSHCLNLNMRKGST